MIVTTFDHTKGFAEDAQLTSNLVNAAVDHSVKHIVLISSWTVKMRYSWPIIHISYEFVANRHIIFHKILLTNGTF